MSTLANRPLLLQVPVAQPFIRLASLFVGEGCERLGLDETAAEKMALAAEEIVAYLVRAIPPGSEVAIRSLPGSYYVQTSFSFPLAETDLRALNMTATVNLEEEDGLEQMELLIASRMADRFLIARKVDGSSELTLIKEFSYPQLADAVVADLPATSPAGCTIREPDSGQIRWFLRLVNHCYPPSLYPKDFLYPGKVVDMAAAGDIRLLLAVGPAGEIGGGIAWRWDGQKMVEQFGPYCFSPHAPAEMASQLMDGCIQAIARSPALVLINRMPTPAMPAGYLEALGSLSSLEPGGSTSRLTALFRELHEDMGAVSWAHPELADFLAAEYRRLSLPREIRLLTADGEATSPSSVLSAEIDRRLGRVTLRPIWPGIDIRENLHNHLNLFRREGLKAIHFAIDLGISWQVACTPELHRLGFRAQLLLPHAGSGDLLLFELLPEPL